jgi:hypothetical protein
METILSLGDKSFKIRSLTLGDRETLMTDFGSLDFTPALEVKTISLCLVEPKLSMDDIRALDANTADYIYIKIMKSSMPSPDFLSELKSISSQAQLPLKAPEQNKS